MNALTRSIAEVIWTTSRNDEGTISATGANIVAAAVVEHLGLTEEDRWVPVAESGERWPPRGREEAMRDLADWPAGVTYATGDPADGITHVLHERRLVSKWVEA